MAIERKTRREKEKYHFRVLTEMERKPALPVSGSSRKREESKPTEAVRTKNQEQADLKKDLLLSLGMMGTLIVAIVVVAQLEVVRTSLHSFSEELLRLLLKA